MAAHAGAYLVGEPLDTRAPIQFAPFQFEYRSHVLFWRGTVDAGPVVSPAIVRCVCLSVIRRTLRGRPKRAPFLAAS